MDIHDQPEVEFSLTYEWHIILSGYHSFAVLFRLALTDNSIQPIVLFIVLHKHILQPKLITKDSKF